jgi:hypothetical protein
MKRHFHTILHHITPHVSMSIHHLQGYIFTIAFTRSNVAPCEGNGKNVPLKMMD